MDKYRKIFGLAKFQTAIYSSDSQSSFANQIQKSYLQIRKMKGTHRRVYDKKRSRYVFIMYLHCSYLHINTIYAIIVKVRIQYIV